MLPNFLRQLLRAVHYANEACGVAYIYAQHAEQRTTVHYDRFSVQTAMKNSRGGVNDLSALLQCHDNIQDTFLCVCVVFFLHRILPSKMWLIVLLIVPVAVLAQNLTETRTVDLNALRTWSREEAWKQDVRLSEEIVCPICFYSQYWMDWPNLEMPHADMIAASILGIIIVSGLCVLTSIQVTLHDHFVHTSTFYSSKARSSTVASTRRKSRRRRSSSRRLQQEDLMAMRVCSLLLSGAY